MFEMRYTEKAKKCQKSLKESKKTQLNHGIGDVSTKLYLEN